MKKIKIAFFAEILIDDFDGAARTMFQLIRRIPKDRFEFLFVCGVGLDRIEGFECIHVPAFTIPVNKTYKMAVPWFSGRRLRQKLEAFQPDVVHIATPSLLGEFALKYANRRGLPVLSIYHTHFISYIDYYLKSSPRLAAWLRKRVAAGQKSFYNRCDRIYVPTEEMRLSLLSWQVEAHRMQIWQRGIDAQLFNPAKRDTDLVQALTGNQQPVILYASRLVWEKNLETLIRIYQRMQAQQLPYNMVVAGDGVALEACQRRMPGAIFTGNLDHAKLSALYASSDVFLFPSISESYGNVVLEAMASGLPCVLADGGGSRNFIQQGVNGFLCQPNDETDYLNRINALLQDVALHRQCVDAGLRYSQSFNWDELATTYFDDMAQLALTQKHA